MEQNEIQCISNYLKDLEEGLYEQDYTGIIATRKLDELYPIIKTLMDETFKTKDKQLKILLASLEYKARRCKHYIEHITAIKN